MSKKTDLEKLGLEANVPLTKKRVKTRIQKLKKIIQEKSDRSQLKVKAKRQLTWHKWYLERA